MALRLVVQAADDHFSSVRVYLARNWFSLTDDLLDRRRDRSTPQTKMARPAFGLAGAVRICALHEPARTWMEKIEEIGATTIGWKSSNSDRHLNVLGSQNDSRGHGCEPHRELRVTWPVDVVGKLLDADRRAPWIA